MRDQQETPNDLSLEESVMTLELYNLWRRGEDELIGMPHPRVIGKAIDTVVTHYKTLLEISVNAPNTVKL